MAEHSVSPVRYQQAFMERYDPSTNEWEEEAVSPMPPARRYVGMAVLDGKLYVAGGHINFTASSSVERYDLTTKAWEVVAPMVTPRENHALAVLDGKLDAVGGYSDDDDLLSSVERYDPATDAWEAVAPMATARRFHAVAVLDGKLYAVGGVGLAVGFIALLTSVERYDPALDAWEAVAPMAEPRVGFGVAVLDGKLYAVGGRGNADDGLLSSVERYDPALNAWETVAPMGTARIGSIALV